MSESMEDRFDSINPADLIREKVHTEWAKPY